MIHHIKKFLFIIINIITLFGFAVSVSAQNYAFEGALFLNGQKSKPMSYRIDFTLLNGVIRGHSITDLFGAHETKNEIRGTYTPSDGVITFLEEAIVYTKSPLQRDIFCFVRFSGKVLNDSGIARLKGEFTGRYKNQQLCARGNLVMLGSADVQKLLADLANKINQTDIGKIRGQGDLNPVQLYDSLQSRRLNAGENLNIFMDADAVTLSIRDQILEDGDIISLFQNGRPLLKCYKVTAVPHLINITLNTGENVFTLEAVDEGTRPPNTAMVTIQGPQRVEFQSNLKKGQKATVQIVRSQP
ncbi:MAG: hypothetical protein FJ344_08485 [Sphingomonadales bacterium]|nr:hypothetical protein [Sphingomonadales bacterium]